MEILIKITLLSLNIIELKDYCRAIRRRWSLCIQFDEKKLKLKMVRKSHCEKLTSLCLWKNCQYKWKNALQNYFNHGNKKLNFSQFLRYRNRQTQNQRKKSHNRWRWSFCSSYDLQTILWQTHLKSYQIKIYQIAKKLIRSNP